MENDIGGSRTEDAVASGNGNSNYGYPIQSTHPIVGLPI
jgi:hypothetical protein